MKAVGWIALGIVVGFVLGSIPGRREAASLQRRMVKLERDLRRAPRGNPFRAPLPGFDEIMAAPAAPAAPAPARPDAGLAQAPAAPPSEPLPLVEGTSGTRIEEFDAVVEAQKLRASQSRAALAEQASLDGERLQAVDRIVARMNDQLVPYGDELIQMMTSNAQPRAREMLGLTHDLTGILYESQMALEAAVGNEALDEVDETSLEIWNYIDLAAFRTYVVDQENQARGAEENP